MYLAGLNLIGRVLQGNPHYKRLEKRHAIISLTFCSLNPLNIK